MAKRTAENDTLVESIFHEHSTESLEERIKLIRILSRSSTLPKVEGILIRSMMSRPDGFYIHAGHSINIGVHLLSNPIAALLCLRYGIEWQIWYQRMSQDQIDVRICDLAACRVTARFYELIPQEDKEAIDQIPADIAEIILRFRSDREDIPHLDPETYETLGILHNQTYMDGPIDEELLEVVRHLAHPTEAMLMLGGDLRLNVDPIQLLNKYGCRPFPRPEALTFASSTATSVSNVAFNRTETKRQYLIESALHKGIRETLQRFASHLKTKLRKALALPESVTLILAPSGTDISLQLAGICQAVYPEQKVHILVASDETGSGVPLALLGRHFSDRTALGFEVTKGDQINGFDQDELIKIPLRNDQGDLRSPADIDEEVIRTVRRVMKENKQPVLHVMDQSKLGYSAPSTGALKDLDQEFGKRLLKIVDNSQLRMDQEDIRAYIKRNYLMTITGSKYFTGPPFSGALIIPKKYATKWAAPDNKLPEGLEEYNCKNECPSSWNIGRNLPKCLNLGLYMRWYSAIVEIQRYFNTPISLRYLGIEMFCNHVAQAIEQAPFLEPLPDTIEPVKAPDEPIDRHMLKNRRTIFPFFIRTPDRVLTLDEVTHLYRLLNQNLSDQMGDAPEEWDRIASQACHIGQPVKAIHKDGTVSGVVRISLGARVISESWKDRDVSIYFQKIEEQMNQVDIIVRKIDYLLSQIIDI
ncbi:hypothetical protein KUV50_00650 [Membranicola marinus]|uniref:Uncharacterized protein n=1 Tax=Membranihabitans marinus TaxID=1227546 RepID=A0A953L5I5_9BACT|nr:hypothetical protein [Membranihabitans marinus]MBY5956622.1 hypothetical protein [Membranihabitans marinus]